MTTSEKRARRAINHEGIRGLIGVSNGGGDKEEKTPYGSDGDDADYPPHPQPFLLNILLL